MPAVPNTARNASTVQRRAAGPSPNETRRPALRKSASAIANATALRKKLFWNAEIASPWSSVIRTHIPITAKPNAEATRQSAPLHVRSFFIGAPFC